MDIDELNKEMFSNATNYLIQSRVIFSQEYRDFLQRNISLNRGYKVLDVGCGLGFLAKNLKEIENSLQISGFDYSEELIKNARDNSNIEFITGNVYNIPYSESFFDLTICQTLFIHLVQPERALKEMIRVTKSTGQIVVIEPILHIDGLDQFAPNEAQSKINKRLALLKFDIEKKREQGIDMHIARKIPYLFSKYQLNDVTVSSFNLINYNQTIIDDNNKERSGKIEFNSYDKMMIKLGYPKDKLEQLRVVEKEYENTIGEFSLTTLLLVKGIKLQF